MPAVTKSTTMASIQAEAAAENELLALGRAAKRAKVGAIAIKAMPALLAAAKRLVRAKPRRSGGRLLLEADVLSLETAIAKATA